MKDPKIICMIDEAIFSYDVAKNYQKLSKNNDLKISFYLIVPVGEE